MAYQEDWLMNPILEGLCSYAELRRKRLNLEDFARMNEALMVRAHNQKLLSEADRDSG